MVKLADYIRQRVSMCEALGDNDSMTRKVQKREVARFLDAWFAVRQFIQAANFNRFQGAGLSATQFMTLNLLPVDGTGVAIGELARRMNLKAATVAKTVDSLEARGMVTRVREVADKRVVWVKVTAAGAELQNAAQGQFQKQIAEVFGGMTTEERQGLIAGLESLVHALGRGRGPDFPDESDATSRAGRGDLPEWRSSQRSARR